MQDPSTISTFIYILFGREYLCFVGFFLKVVYLQNVLGNTLLETIKCNNRKERQMFFYTRLISGDNDCINKFII